MITSRFTRASYPRTAAARAHLRVSRVMSSCTFLRRASLHSRTRWKLGMTNETRLGQSAAWAMFGQLRHTAGGGKLQARDRMEGHGVSPNAGGAVGDLGDLQVKKRHCPWHNRCLVGHTNRRIAWLLVAARMCMLEDYKRRTCVQQRTDRDRDRVLYLTRTCTVGGTSAYTLDAAT